MIYINDPKQPFYKYDDVVKFIIKAGVEPKRAYIYLASLGVKGALARVMSADEVGYLPAIKVAIKNGVVVSGVSVCKNCDGVVIK